MQPLAVPAHLQRRLEGKGGSGGAVKLKKKKKKSSKTNSKVSKYQRGHGEADDLDAAVVVALRLKVAVVAGVPPRHSSRAVPAAAQPRAQRN